VNSRSIVRAVHSPSDAPAETFLTSGSLSQPSPFGQALQLRAQFQGLDGAADPIVNPADMRPHCAGSWPLSFAAAALEFVASIPLAGSWAIDGRHAADVVRRVYRNNNVALLPPGCETKKQAVGERPVFGESAIGSPLSTHVFTVGMASRSDRSWSAEMAPSNPALRHLSRRAIGSN